MKSLILMISMLTIFGCGNNDNKQKRDFRSDNSSESKEVRDLKNTILSLEGTVAMITAFVANDYSDCGTGLPAFETKICRIAQTANIEQIIALGGQLNRISAIMQESLYGPDCINDTDVGCPVTGSVMADLAAFDPNDITTLQTDVGNLQMDVTALEGRLDNFNGSGNSIETVISGLDTDITNLESRVTAIETVLNGSDHWEWAWFCHDVTTVTTQEPFAIRGDRLQLKYYVHSTDNRMGTFEAGTTGDLYTTTSTNPKCKLKIYDLTTDIKICWNNSNRNATEVNINTECDSANSFTTPTANCTCI